MDAVDGIADGAVTAGIALVALGAIGNPRHHLPESERDSSDPRKQAAHGFDQWWHSNTATWKERSEKFLFLAKSL